MGHRRGERCRGATQLSPYAVGSAVMSGVGAAARLFGDGIQALTKGPLRDQRTGCVPDGPVESAARVRSTPHCSGGPLAFRSVGVHEGDGDGADGGGGGGGGTAVDVDSGGVTGAGSRVSLSTLAAASCWGSR